MLLSSLKEALKEKSHDSSEAANAAFKNDSKKLISHHASLQTAEQLNTKMMLCRTSAGDDLAALQDAPPEPSESDFFEDFSGKSRRQAMALAGLGNSFQAQRARDPDSPPRKFFRGGTAAQLSDQGLPMATRPARNWTRPWGDVGEHEHQEEVPEIEEGAEEPWEERKGNSKGKGGKGRGGKGSKGATTATNQILSKAEEALSKYREGFTDLKLWEMKVKSRTVDTMSTALNRHASQIMGLNSQDEKVQELAEHCVAFADSVAEKVKLIHTIRQAPDQSAKLLDDSQWAVGLQFDLSVLCAITAWVAGHTVKDMEQEGQGASPFFLQSHCLTLPLDGFDMSSLQLA